MSRLGELLGSKTRGNVVEALALSEKPLSAYRIARSYNMNVAKVYGEAKRLDRLGVLKSSTAGSVREYTLADADLKKLALKLGSRVTTYEEWASREAKRERFLNGMASVPRFEFDRKPSTADPLERRLPGELENLATLGRKKFDSKYAKTSERSYARV